MTVEQIGEKFELFADAPGAVEKIRQVILALAVQGKLLPQDPNDESVEDSLARNDELRRETALRDHRADENNQPLLSDEDRWVITENWSWRGLADLVLFVDYRGKTPAKLPSGIRLLTAKNVRKGQINLAPEEFLSESEYHAWMTRGFPKSGDVLFTTEAPMGNAAVVKLTERFALAQRVICFQSYGAIDPDFLVLQILSDPFQFILDKNGTGMTAKGIKASKLKQLPIAIPPLAEQKRIVAKVDELMALCDRLETQQREREARHAVLARASLARFADAPTPANLNLLFHHAFTISPAEIRKAILALAVQGKLVPQDSNEGQVKSVPVGEVVHFLGGYAFKSEWFQRTPGIRLVRNQNIGHGELDWSDTEYLPAERAGEFIRFELHPGDLVLSLNRPFISTGLKLAWIRKSDCPCLLVQRVACLRPVHNRLSAEYLFLWCNTPHFYQDAHVVPSSGVPYIATNRVEKMLLRLPPLAEQRRIVAKVDQLMALVDQLESQLATARDTAANLLDAFVTKLTGTTAASTNKS